MYLARNTERKAHFQWFRLVRDVAEIWRISNDALFVYSILPPLSHDSHHEPGPDMHRYLASDLPEI